VKGVLKRLPSLALSVLNGCGSWIADASYQKAKIQTLVAFGSMKRHNLADLAEENFFYHVPKQIRV
jgi:hypothetical protein